MVRSLAKLSRIAPPPGLAKLFSELPLVGNETREDYEGLFTAIATATKPADPIAWLIVRDITDLSWEIKRERNLKRQVMNYSYQRKIRELLTPYVPSNGEFVSFLKPQVISPEAQKIYDEVNEKMKQWAGDPKRRRKVEKGLEDQGYDAAYISRAAQTACASEVDAIDRRIASYEMRRMAALKTMDNYNEAVARRLRAVNADVIDGEFTEAAE
jgi:hypothetical protein